MYRKIAILFISIVIVLASFTVVQAASATATLTPSSTTVKPGDTFSVTLSLNCADGINGATGITFNYDKNILELTSSNIKDSNFINLGTSDDIDLMCNSEENITSANVYVWNFKVKDTATIGTNTTFSVGDIAVDSFAENNSETIATGKSITVTIEDNSNSEETGNNSNPTQGNVEENGEEAKAEEPEKSTDLFEDAETLPEQETEKTSETSGKTTSSNAKTLPKAGMETWIGISAIVLAVIGIVSYIRYKTIKLK